MFGKKKQIIKEPSSFKTNEKMLVNKTGPSKIPVPSKNGFKRCGAPPPRPGIRNAIGKPRKKFNEPSKVPVRMRRPQQSNSVSENMVNNRGRIEETSPKIYVSKIPVMKRRELNIEVPPNINNITERMISVGSSNNMCFHQKSNSQAESGQYSATGTTSSNMAHAEFIATLPPLDEDPTKCQIIPNRKILFKHYIGNWENLVELNENSYESENLDRPISSSEYNMLNEADSQHLIDVDLPTCRPCAAGTFIRISGWHDFEDIEEEICDFPTWHDIFLAIQDISPNHLQTGISQRLQEEDQLEEENVSNFFTISVICAVMLPTLFICRSFFQS